MSSGRLSVLALTPGAGVPSARFRWQQYVGELRRSGLDASEIPSRAGAFAPGARGLRPLWLAGSLAENFARVLRSNRHDLRFLQRPLIATLRTWEPLLRRPFVFDVDDAIFLGPRGGSADRIARSAAMTLCGNAFLAEHFSRHGRVEVLPTAVDTARFTLRAAPLPSRPVIGWSGTSSNFRYLHDIEPALLKLLKSVPDAVFKVVSDRQPEFRLLPPGQVLYERWTPEREVAVLHEFTVGLMPLEDSLWARGKCSFKMLTYMAVGLPVVVSPVGMNAEVLAQGPCGLPASTTDEWVDAMSFLLLDDAMAVRMGRLGRRIVETHYAQNTVAPRLARLLRSVA
ncbi:glycosyltransferase [Variovorax sp. JS1663]|uniref:glycosyltransferase n=1 Tax=Variovorax sp. JS1663 TaxID=1851577 RepID=UPI000B346ECB|nr:glycosyltransferase [Variovorax sp. JS1663]